MGSLPNLHAGERVVTLVKKDPNKGYSADNFRPVLLLNTDLKILAKVVMKMSLRVADGLVGEAQTCAIPGRSIQDNLHLIH